MPAASSEQGGAPYAVMAAVVAVVCKRGRPRLYGDKYPLKRLFEEAGLMQTPESLMTTDLALEPLDVIRLYGYRFKIEVGFKSALHVVGAFLYHFWMRDMTPITRKARNQYLHRKPAAYRDAVRRKLAAYHRFIQLGLIAQGIMQALATTVPQLVWASFGSWLRTIRPGIVPSEAVVACALRNTLPHFLADSSPAPILAKFIQQHLDLSRAQVKRLAALGAFVIGPEVPEDSCLETSGFRIHMALLRKCQPGIHHVFGSVQN